MSTDVFFPEVCVVRVHWKYAAASVAVALIAALSGCAPDPEAVPAEPVAGTSVAVASTPPATSTPTPSPTPSAEESVTAIPDATETPTPTPTSAALLQEGDDSDEVRELQHRLLQLQWYEGDITSTFDEKTRLAVEGFQTKRGFNATGEVDQETWDKLVDMTRQPTDDEMHNILRAGPALFSKGDSGDEVKEIQARLKQIAWFSGDITGNYGDVTVEAVKGFQRKREIPVTGEVDQRTLDRLDAMTRTPTTDELNNVVTTASSTSMTLDDRCLTGRVICISKAQRKLAWVVDGQISMVVDVRFGSELTPTRNGVFSVNWKSRDHVSSLYHTSMPYALFFSGGQAVHYSSDFAARGYNGASHGCVNVRDKAAVAKLFDLAQVGDKVVVYTG
ncbi:L,D-transpeptidase family protein [Tessaracoccus lacteus]|uniref:L,D-transpeptidase family protein n=1 Tax=Tessaracoccus lacteus TaxID=3041766 RepID=A0ABY8Q0H0_9ACTN|nr:L,D-transpeptidase family protein [Tessaracoccus sp. T21]WGT48214.1 L,D-transpeptidase family protein [Tessaracoccus sp. T21]